MGCILAISIVLFIFWLLGFTIFALGALVHIALALAVIFVILWLLRAIFRLF